MSMQSMKFSPLLVITLLILLSGGQQVLADIRDNDKNNTLSPNLPSKQVEYIDNLQTDYDQQIERHGYVSSSAMDNEKFDALLTQWKYLNHNYHTGHLFQTTKSELSRTLYIKDLLMRVMGAVHSVLEPNYGGDLEMITHPNDSNILQIDLNAGRVVPAGAADD